jgi:hypothetical protein
MNDWNAADADLKVPKPGLLARLSFTSPKSITKRALAEAEAGAISPEDEPRFANIAQGLAERLTFGGVDLYVIELGGPNALAGRAEKPVVAVTRSLLDNYARTELEAVVAHCLVRHRDAGRKGVRVGYADDVRAAALTRYPPALVAAIEKAHPYEGRFPGAYLVAAGPTHRPLQERIAALNDL